MGRDTPDTDLQVAGHNLAVHPELHTGGGPAEAHRILKGIMVIDSILLHNTITEFLAGIDHIIGPVSTKRPDEPYLLFVHTCAVKCIQNKRCDCIHRCRPGHVIKYNYCFLPAPGEFFQGHTFYWMPYFISYVLLVHTRLFQTGRGQVVERPMIGKINFALQVIIPESCR